MLASRRTILAWGLALLIGSTASAQTASKENQDKEQQHRTQTQAGGNSSQNQQTETIRGELASISVVGETMVNYDNGQGVMAEMTYMTILGSSKGSNAMSGEHRDRAQSGSERKDATEDKSRTEGKDRDAHGESGRSWGRRNVYQIAVGPETQVEDRTMNQGGTSNNRQESTGNSARARYQAALDKLELGDRVEVEFDRSKASSAGSNANNDQSGSASRQRHGRHRIVRGVAKKIIILSTPEQHEGKETERGSNSK